MTEPKCSRCGATNVNERVCKYCGSLLHGLTDPEEERRALQELQKILQEADPDKRKELMKSAFLPDHVPHLIEAGLTTLPFMDFGSGSTAAQRLEAIALKLRLSSTDPKAIKAAEEFEARLAAYWRNDRMFLVGCIVTVIVIVGGLAALIIKLMNRN